MMRLFCLLFFLHITLFSTFAATAKTAVFKTDSSTVDLRRFSKAAMQEYASAREFKYGESIADVSPSLWDRFWSWFWGLFSKAFSNAVSGGGFKWVFIGLGAAAVIFAVLKIAGMDIMTLFTGKSRRIETPYTESLENIHEISFDAEIEQAIKSGNFRLAVRLLYLKSLKKLTDAGRINWQPDKTNSQYIDELSDTSQKKSFRMLTHQFEYVWYGGFSIDTEGFNRVKSSFDNFNRGQYT